jgi:lysyl endopeptidase
MKPSCTGSAARAAWGIAAAVLLTACIAAPALAERNLSGQRPASAKSASVATLALGVSPAATIRLGPLSNADIDSIHARNAAGGLRALKLGVVRDVSTIEGTHSDSLAWHPVQGGNAAQWSVSADGAQALRVELAVAQAPPGVRARFAASGSPGRSHEARLPVSGSLWSPVIEGDSAIVELFAPEGTAPSAVSVALAKVAHHVLDPIALRNADLAKSGATSSCEVDLACVANDDPALARAGAAVSRITYVSEGYVWACTGTLLNPGDGSFTPYYYTAAHCIPDQETASTVVTLWFQDADSCGGNSASSSVQVDGGAQLLVADTTLDGALLRLANPPPDGAIFAGWDSLPPDPLAAIAAIHHPEGGLKKVNEGTEAGYSDERFLAATWTRGITEDGSSGSAMFTVVDAPRRDYLLRGTLVGGTSACNAGTPTGFDLYSRFDLMWPKLAPYLSADKPGSNHSGLWWNAAEPGWGLDVSHQQGVIMATLFTYSAKGDPLWVIGSSLREQQDGTFTGDLFQVSGPAFDAAPWGRTVARTVGTMRLAFSGADAARVTYTIDGTTVTKEIAPMPVGDGTRPICSFTTDDRAKATNYQDLWWNPSESGWGVAIAHAGDTLFTVLFSYGDDGSPLWLAGPAVARQADGGYAGTLYRTKGPAFDASPWTAAAVESAGTIALRFADGDSATLSYTVDGRAVKKTITRFAISPSAPACR